MRLQTRNRIRPQAINDRQVLLEHVRVLVVFIRDVLLQRFGQGDRMRAAEGEGEDIPRVEGGGLVGCV